MIFIGTLVVALLSWFVLVRHVKDGIERICSFFMPLLAFIILVFAITVSFLPGGLDGWIYYLKPILAVWERQPYGGMFLDSSSLVCPWGLELL